MGGGSQQVTQRTELSPEMKRAIYGVDLSSERYLAEQEAMKNYYGLANGGPVSAGIGSMPQAQGAMMALGQPMGVPPMGMPPQPMAPAMPQGNMAFNPLDLTDPALSYYMAQGQQPQMPAYARGGYVEGPGTGRSDSIPARIHQNGVPVQEAALSDGEFVMTERAVRGAGDGDRAAGAARMYDMMRQFEGRG